VADLNADLAVLLEGQLLAAALAAGHVKEGCKLPLVPALAPPPPPAPASKQPTGLAAGFLGKPAAPAKAAPGDNRAANGTAAAAPPTPAASASASPPSPPSAATGQSGSPAGSSSDGSGSRPEAKPQLDPLHRLMATSKDPNQGGRAAARFMAAAARLRAAVTPPILGSSTAALASTPPAPVCGCSGDRMLWGWPRWLTAADQQLRHQTSTTPSSEHQAHAALELKHT
jgi:hypothetical protein